jgi:dihydropteroate synthase
MGVLNVTPDSFSDGGRFHEPGAALEQARRLFEDGADILDVGGESSRPGAMPVDESVELERVLPVVRAFRDRPVSVDTRRASVMKAVLDEGASMINDIEALSAPGAIETVARSDCGICLMHKQGAPATMQDAPRYKNVVEEVSNYLRDRIGECERGGIGRDRICVDPGYGFGKTVRHNLRLLRQLPYIVALGVPVLAGWSRKSSLGAITGRPVTERLAGSLAAALLALQGGATILRVHDVRETKDVVAVWEAWRK